MLLQVLSEVQEKFRGERGVWMYNAPPQAFLACVPFVFDWPLSDALRGLPLADLDHVSHQVVELLAIL